MDLLNEYMKEKGISESEVNMFDFYDWEMIKLLDEIK